MAYYIVYIAITFETDCIAITFYTFPLNSFAMLLFLGVTVCFELEVDSILGSSFIVFLRINLDFGSSLLPFWTSWLIVFLFSYSYFYLDSSKSCFAIDAVVRSLRLINSSTEAWPSLSCIMMLISVVDLMSGFLFLLFKSLNLIESSLKSKFGISWVKPF